MGVALRTGTLAGLLALRLPACAHEGPEHEIEELTERIKKEGESDDLLLQRAIEYKVLGNYAEAARDLERASSLNANSIPVQRELSRAYTALGKTNEALQTVSRALKYAGEAADHASLLIVRAEIFQSRKEYKKSLEDADKAIGELPGNVDWYLLRSQLHAALKQKKERVQGLEEGVRETGSGMLEGEWIEALIENGQHPLALEKIEAEMRDSRLQSTWLIRRAKVRLAAGQKDGARADLRAAVEELNKRAIGASPDPLLLADRGLAYELLGEKEDAKKDYEKAREKGVTDEWLRERLRVLKDAEEREKKKDEPK